MARAFVFPDPKDRSYNEPGIIVDQPKVLGLFNQETGQSPKRQIVTEDIKKWFREEAERRGWDSADFLGNQCALKVDFNNHKWDTRPDGDIPT